MENLEMISFQIISCVGTAKSSYIEAARKAQAFAQQQIVIFKKFQDIENR